MNLGLDLQQVRQWIVKPTLEYLGLWSLSAERLVLGTAVHESRLRYIDQIDKYNRPGPAFGLWQMEGPTHADLYNSFLSYQPELKLKVTRLASFYSGSFPDPGEMVGNLKYACAMCRIHYRRVKAPLPDDVRGLAEYAKRYYNSMLGKATVQQYQDAIQYVIDQEKP